jgi:hypothetical protein
LRLYAAVTPDFFPRLVRPATQETILVSAPSFQQAMSDATWILAAIVGLEVLEAVHLSAILRAWVLPW